MFSDIAHNFIRIHFQDVEVDGFAEGSALTNNDNISDLYVESGGAVYWDVSVSFLISVVFGDIVKIITSDDDGPLHLGADYNTLEDLSPDGDIASEWAFFVNISGFNSFLGGLES